MAQVMQGNAAALKQSTQAAQPGTGMVVGLTINKPISINPLTPAGLVANVGVATTQSHGVAISGTANQQLRPLTNGAEQQGDLNNMANTKEKTPMCLVNELARFNKIQHTYTLIDEQGPAHKKTFYVKLKLGDEEYNADGPSIKKAQHSAASSALDTTKYSRPVPRQRRGMPIQSGNSTYPTVELNALAMKRGEPAIYQSMEHTRPVQFYPPNLNFRGMYNQRYHYPGMRAPRFCYISLKVGHREFIGEGDTRKSARHNAAAKALRILSHLPMPDQNDDSTDHADTVGSPGHPLQNGDFQDGAVNSVTNEELKSEISLVHEVALRRNMTVNFEVMRESGPPHLRTFVTRCLVGEFTTEADGNSKKLSKKRAAEKMLELLKTLPSLPPSAIKVKPKLVQNKKKNRNLIKMQKANLEYGDGINPISRLIQIQQAKKEKEPIYTLVAEKGLPRRREFHIQVTVGNQSITGTGPNKKLAKRSAAEAMLLLLGYSKPMPQPGKPAIKTSSTEQNGTDKRVKFIDQDAASGDNRGHKQIVPGVLVMTDSSYTGAGTGQGLSRVVRGGIPNAAVAIAKELLDTGSSPTAEAYLKSEPSSTGAQPVVSPKKQLLYLADVLGFQVQFTDFPKGDNKNELLSLVSLSTNPPQVSHGAGLTLDKSHDLAALTALKALAEMGLDSTVQDKKPVKKEGILLASGDGPHMKSEAEK